MIRLSFLFILCIASFEFSLAKVTSSGINFLFLSGGKRIGYFNETSVEQAVFNTTLPTKVIVHNALGFQRKHIKFRLDYEKKGAYNIVFVNWSKVTRKGYRFAIENLKKVAGAVATFIGTAKFDPNQTHLVAAGLGSHLSGLASREYTRKYKNKLSRITALSPNFCHRVEPANQLKKEDALMVDTVITYIRFDRCKHPYGHVDFLANGGYHQPGCSENNVLCNEARSTSYFIESILTQVHARPAESWEAYLKGNYTGDKYAIFGENVAKHATGVFYIKTNSTAPYLIPSK